MQNSPARPGIDVGSVIAETYAIEALIGRGGMGAVFMASHRRLPGKKIAIKVLHAELAGDEVLKRFQREAEIASKLGHPNIVGVHDFNVLADGTPYLVLEYLEGESLAQRLARGPLPLEQVMSIVRQVGSALAAAHREGIVHRDLKPQNVFLVPTEVAGRQLEIAKVLDFGISKIRGSQTVKTQDSTLLGTPQYMAPEQATGQHAKVDERTDVFAFGAMVYELLCGQPAFAGASIPEVVFKVVYEPAPPLEALAPALPPAVVAAVARAMAKAPEDRFPTASAFVEALTGEPLTLRSAPVPPELAGSVPPSRVKSTGNDAFAATMGSGPHGDSPLAATSAIGATQVPQPVAPAATAAPAVMTAAPAATAGPTVTAAAPAAPPRRRTAALIVACVIGGAALAAGAMYFVMHRDPPGRRHAHHGAETAEIRPHEGPAADQGPAVHAVGSETTTAGSDTPATAGAGGSDVASAAHAGGSDVASTAHAGGSDATTAAHAGGSDATSAAHAGGSDATAAAHAGSSETKPPASHAGGPGAKTTSHAHAGGAGKTMHGKHAGGDTNDTPPEDEPGDATSRQRLRDAETSLRAEQWERAERLANMVATATESSAMQRARAHALHGIIQCRARSNEEGAQIDLRYLRRSPVLRRRVIQACHAAGMLRGTR